MSKIIIASQLPAHQKAMHRYIRTRRAGEITVRREVFPIAHVVSVQCPKCGGFYEGHRCHLCAQQLADLFPNYDMGEDC